MDKSRKTFEVPDSVLNTIDECSSGGYVLFTIDERGEPKIYYSFDSGITALALQKYCQLWAEAMHEISLNHTIDGLSRAPAPPEDDEDSQQKTG